MCACMGVYVESDTHICIDASPYVCACALYFPAYILCVCNGLGLNIISRFRIRVTSLFSLFGPFLFDEAN